MSRARASAEAPLGVACGFSGRPWAWRAAPLDLAQAQAHAEDAVAAGLALARGCTEAELERVLRPRLRDWLPDPSAFRDMDAAAERLADAVVRGEAITVFADYDVDGATSAAILLRTLRALGSAPDHYIPDRLLEGYGPTPEALLALAARGTRLVVLLDCGTHAFAALEAARAAGLEAIVVDHHKAATALPPACAIVNPNRFDELADGGVAAAHAGLCTAGLAFLLAVALVRALRRRGWFATRPEPALPALLDLVALGTVADVMPLVGLNRAFVALGLKRLAARANPGLAALLEVSRLSAASARDLGFHLGPRVNAGGRVGTADLGVRLLTTEDPEEARRLAAELDALNAARREIEAAVTEAALAAVDPAAPVAVAAGEGWHPGVIGIAAGRLKDRLDRPAIVIAREGDRPAKGSGRSVPGVDLGAAVLEARERGLLLAGGGHAMAAGLTVAPHCIPALVAFLAERLGPALAARPATRPLAVDLSLAPRGLTPALHAALAVAGPFGAGWPAPRVAVGPVRVVEAAETASGGHVRLLGAGPDGARVRAVMFRAAATAAGAALLGARGRLLHLAGEVVRNDWQGEARAELHLDDAAPAD
ncbi:single-stranded-DNA-specific exonuclease RecJ [Thermaurantiacus tibetensis]|uniref:single-stranded-DNA-specific exonuclease RecJ n=1 Tax=Thermaurantiacus tibetensis TaxID=2759035 RepID=UPI00188DE500|nr:single-stranded-DNA-specific exonuclease RecJ [Thermaurantiacus tibetensis]